MFSSESNMIVRIQLTPMLRRYNDLVSFYNLRGEDDKKMTAQRVVNIMEYLIELERESQ